MATDQLINKSQGDAIIAVLTAIKNAIIDQPVPTQVEDVVADAFDVGVAYVPGDYCIYENKLYICNAPHHGAWDGNDFTLTTVGTVLESLNNDLVPVPNYSSITSVYNGAIASTSKTLVYTATSDCWLRIRIQITNTHLANTLSAFVNNVAVLSIVGAGTANEQDSILIPVRKGDKIYSQTDSTALTGALVIHLIS